MAEIAPLHALHFDQAVAGPLQALWSPPYDVIDGPYREELAARSPYNAVRVDLPEGDEPYANAARRLEEWTSAGALVRDPEPALWALEQAYRAPDGTDRVRRGFLCRVRIEDYGAGRVRPHERTHPGPKEDRLRLTRATQANLSPVFSLFSDPDGRAARALAGATAGAVPQGEVTDDDGNVHRLWRVAEEHAVAEVVQAARPAELLIADGHHRYETARVYAQEAGTEAAGWVLMCLVALEDPGLTVFPTHRLVKGTTTETQQALRTVLLRDWEVEPVSEQEVVPPPSTDGRVRIGYMDSFHRQPYRLTLKEPGTGPLARLDTAVTEGLLKGPLRLTDHHIDHLEDFGYARDARQALAALHDGSYDLAFFMGPTPVERIQEIAAAGESMPPKSTYFFPKILTGLVFNPLR